ncbi:hypothetical protein LWI29_008042 [Acer saccharum]|uniref:Uncharacterized protein n=1 Tax=Acer saccharum TaxID=4024 RepID=A0AA39SP73_ACESA|nr:hypothetical protein LWI29_008042 [Acer saccharum]
MKGGRAESETCAHVRCAWAHGADFRIAAKLLAWTAGNASPLRADQLCARQGRREEVWGPRRETVDTVQQQPVGKGTPVGVSEAAGLCGNKGSENVLISSAQEALGMGDDQVLEGGLNEHCGTNVVFELNDGENPMQMVRPREPLNGELSEAMHANNINVLKEASGIINSGVAYSLDTSGETRTLEATDVHQKKGNWKRRAREEKEDCLEVVKKGWFAVHSGSCVQRVVEKLGAVSTSLKKWNGLNKRQLKDNIEVKKRELAAMSASRRVDWGLQQKLELELDELLRSQMGVEEYLGVCEIDSTDEGTLCLDFEIDSCFGMSSPSRKAYRRQLAEIFNVNRSRILAFKNKPPTPVELILQSHSKPTCSPLLHHSTDALFLRNLRKYFYLRDPWDPSDDATSELVTVDDELVTSVSWAPDGHHIAVGWNILKYKYGIPLLIGRLRTLKGGHRSGGNNHILTTGGMDGNVINNDIRVRDHVNM